MFKLYKLRLIETRFLSKRRKCVKIKNTEEYEETLPRK